MAIQSYQQNLFSRSFTAQYDDGRGAGLSCKYDLHRASRPAHVIYVCQTSQSRACLEDMQDDISTVYNNLSSGDSLGVIAFDSWFSTRDFSIRYDTLEEVLDYVRKTPGQEACLWKAATKACSMFKARAHSIRHDNCFLLINASGYDTRGGSRHAFEAELQKVEEKLPYMYNLGRAKDGSPLKEIFNGEAADMADHICTPGSYYEGSLHMQAYGTGHKPSEVSVMSRHRTPHEAAHQYAKAIPGIAQEIRAEHMLPAAILQIRYS